MIYETIGVFSDAQSLTVSDESDYALDFGDSTNPAAMRVTTGSPGSFISQFGAGRENVWLIIRMGSDASGGDGGTITCDLNASTNTGLTSTTTTTLFSTTTIAKASMTAGAILCCVPIPIKAITSTLTTMRYLGIYYTIATTFTAFTIDAYLSLSPITSLTEQIMPS